MGGASGREQAREISGCAECAAAMLESSVSEEVEGKRLYREYNEKREREREHARKSWSRRPFFLSWVNGFYEANCNDGTSERRSMTDVREDF